MVELKILYSKVGLIIVVLIVLVFVPLAFNVYSAWASVPLEFGYRDFSYPPGTGGNSEPTGEKPESKLWWNDGSWWGVLWSASGNAYHIYRLDLATQDWIDTGTAVDDRNSSRADALWDGSRLYIVSHIFAKNAGAPAPTGQRGELYRYNYDALTDIYSLDPGFPIEVTGGKSETLVVAKDSDENLWVTYVEDKKVMVNHSLNGDDLNWGTPFALPITEAAGLSSDDISSIVTYNQHVGVMWSNQDDKKTFFAVHPVGAADDVWTRVIPYAASSDDHINLKSLETDDAGNVFAVIKTSKSAELIMLLVCKNNLNRCKTGSDWISYPVYQSNDYRPTRPILIIDTSNRDLYVLTRNVDSSGVSGIYYKTSPLDNIQFPAGIGIPFIKDSQYDGINDPTSTKQNVNAGTGLVILASDGGPDYYFHNYKDLSGSTNPFITSFTPTEGIAGTSVTISGANFTGATSVTFNSVATSFSVISDMQIQTAVPPGATTGPISVTNSAGTGTSASDFTVIVPPVIDSISPTEGPAGTEVTLVGSGFTGATDVTFNSVSADSFALDSDAKIRAVVPLGGESGPIAVMNAAGTGTSEISFEVIESPIVTDRSPEPDATGIYVSSVVTVTFSKPMDELTINSNTFTLADADGLISGAVSYNSGTQTATFAPDNMLKADTHHTVTLHDGIKDEVGTTLYGAPEVWSFTSGSATAQLEATSYDIDEAVGTAFITVTLDTPSANIVSVDYATSDGTAKTSDGDYVSSYGTLTFVPGDIQKTISVMIIDDLVDEPTEWLNLILSNPSGVVLGNSTAILNIIDNDGAPTVQFGAATLDVDESDGLATVEVIMNNPATETVSVDYMTLDGTAKAGEDYLQGSGTLTFPSGTLSQSFEIPIIDDGLNEENETIELQLLPDPTNASLGTLSTAILTIIDNDPQPAVNFSSAEYTVNELVGEATITVALSKPSGRTVSVAYKTSDGTAEAGKDYLAVDETLIFAPGETSKPFTIQITYDNIDEPDEWLELTLSAPVGAILSTPSQVKLTIIDDLVRFFLPMITG